MCDAQTTVAESAAVAAYVHALIAWLLERHASGEVLAGAESWRIAENRWIAARRGLDGRLADLVTGERRPVRELMRERLETLAPVAERIGCAAELDGVNALRRAQRRRAPARGRGRAWPAGADRLARRPLPQLALSRPCSAPPGARKRITLCVPSQNGRIRDLPQRQSATVSRPSSISLPSWSSS